MASSAQGHLSAIITGGASGMGLQVATALARRGGWHVHLFDLNAASGQEAASQLENATFHQVNVLDYDSLASTFQTVYDTEGRLDFVFANAGIVERFNFYEKHDPAKPPPPPDQTVIDINLKSVVNTAWLSQHYFQQSVVSADKSIVITASSGSLYPAPAVPSYAAAKHGVLGFMRSIAGYYYNNNGIRVNAICPGPVRTNLLDKATWDAFDQDGFVPLEKISQTVLMLIDGYDDGGKVSVSGQPYKGGVTGGEKLYGEALEISGTDHYYRGQPEFCDERLKRSMEDATQRESYT